MGGTTATYLLPYPVASDPADVPVDVKKLADRLEVVLAQLQAATPAQPDPGDLKWVGYPVAAGSEATQCPGWLLCDGREVSRTGATAALFAKVGTAHGAGNGSTTFNLPDARGRAAIGAGTGPGLTARSLGQKVGEESHLISVGEMPSHDHGGATSAGTLPAHSTNPGSTGEGTTDAASTGTGTSGSTTPATTTSGATAPSLTTVAAGAHQHDTADGTGEFMTNDSSTITVGSGGTARYYAQKLQLTNVAGSHTHTGTVASHTHTCPQSAHTHTVPSLTIPALTVNALSIPALGINAQPIPALTIAGQGGGTAHNNVQPSFVANCLIKT